MIGIMVKLKLVFMMKIRNYSEFVRMEVVSVLMLYYFNMIVLVIWIRKLVIVFLIKGKFSVNNGVMLL